MSQLYLLDTNTASYIAKGVSVAARNSLRSTTQHSRVLISSLSEAELLYGLEIKPQATLLRIAVNEFLQSLEIEPWNSSAAYAYARLRAYLRASGRALATVDLLIASHALALGAILVTHDRDFRFLPPYMKTIDWATDLP